MCTQALLAGAGVGAIGASAVAAAVQWVLRDGVGMIFSVVFSVRFSHYFGEYVKEWRFFADLANDVGLTLDMFSALVPTRLYLPLLCLSAVCKATCGVSAGASKLCITNHFCLQNNASDVATKEGTQETAVTLVGLIAGMIFSYVFDNNSSVAWISFLILTLIHIYANYRAVYSLKLNSLNRSRSWILTKKFLSSKSEKYQVYNDMSVASVNAFENIWITLRIVLDGPRIGTRLQTSLCNISCTATVTPEMRWASLNQAFGDEMYCIMPMRGGTFCVPLRRNYKKVNKY